METEAPYYTWRRTSGAAPDAVKAARPVLNGGREETCRKVTRLAPTQRRGGGDQTGHIRFKRATGRPLIKGVPLKSPPERRYGQEPWTPWLIQALATALSREVVLCSTYGTMVLCRCSRWQPP